jgi:hypothetical protein
MSHFKDDNTVEDILGAISLAQCCPADIDIKSLLHEIIERIQEKLARNKNKTRHNWFSIALDFVKQASASYEQKDSAQGEELLRKAADQLASGNKAHRRKVDFVVDPEGKAKKS